MQLKRINSAIDRIGRNDINENFDILERTYGKTAIDAQEAKRNSDNAVVTSDDAMILAESVQNQFNQVVIEGDSSIEAAQARVSADATTYDTLKARLDAENAQVTQQLAHVEEQSIANANAKYALYIPSYQGAPQSTHPSPLYFPDGWNGYKFWMGFTPYAYENENLENPSVIASNDGIRWEVPAGLTNPLATTDNSVNLHHSDTHLVYNDALNQLEIWYRRTERNALPQRELILRRTSTDGVNWTTEEAMRTVNGTTAAVLSPVIIFEDGKYKIWYNNWETKKIDYYEALNGPDGTLIRSMDYPKHARNFNLWHMDIKHTTNGYEMYYCASAQSQGGYNCTEICYTVSDDNVSFGNAVTVLRKKEQSIDGKRLYRPAFIDIGNERFIYYGVVNNNNEWCIALTFSSVTNPTSLFGFDGERIPKNIGPVTSRTLFSNLRLFSLANQKFLTLRNEGLTVTNAGVVDASLNINTDRIIPELSFKNQNGVYGISEIGKLRIYGDQTTSPIEISKSGTWVLLPQDNSLSIGGLTRLSRSGLVFSKSGVVDFFISPTINSITDAKIALNQGFESSYHYGMDVGWLDVVDNLNTSKRYKIYVDGTRLFIKGSTGEVGQPIALQISGPSVNRPTAYANVGMQYFDTTLSKPIWYNGTNWVDATGATV